jgi:hypothetical protein
MSRELSLEYLEKLKKELKFIEEYIEYYNEIKYRNSITGFTNNEYEGLQSFNKVSCFYEDRVEELKSEIQFLSFYLES